MRLKMKSFTVIALLASTSFAYADYVPHLINDTVSVDSGLYIGLMGGYGLYDKKQNITGNSNKSFKNVAVGADLGYQFNQYIAGELGGYYQFDKQYKASGQTLKYRYNAIGYGALKLIAPLDDFNFFAKLGPAWVHYGYKASAGSTSGSHNYGKVTFLYGGGAAYWFTQYVNANLQVLATVKTGNVPATYTGLLGLEYRFAC